MANVDGSCAAGADRQAVWKGVTVFLVQCEPLCAAAICPAYALCQVHRILTMSRRASMERSAVEWRSASV